MCEDNPCTIWYYLIDKGYTPVQVAGIMGNLQQEHNFQTSDTPGGLGIAQWIGDRKDSLQTNPNWQDLTVQLDFMLYELNSYESSANNRIKQATTIEDATIAFQNGFERCGTCMEGQRINYAYSIYNRFQM